MSINNSYFSRNNTLISGSLTNTGRNPVMELFYGNGSIVDPIGFSRFIFNLDLTLLKEKYSDGSIPPINCNPNMVHTLRMTNTSFFDKELLNTSTSSGRLRATSFDLILFRIPYKDLYPDQPQYWDEGVGYDFADLMTQVPNDKNYSTRSSNWYTSSGMTNWEQAGIYSNTNSGVFTFNDLYIVDTQHFEFGDENIEFNMTSEINSILQGFLTNVAGWGIAYMPQVELLSGTTGTYEVGFFTRHTQTFYEPFLETSFNDIIDDDRNSFSLGKSNKLYLYIYEDGDFQNLDNNPSVSIGDGNGNPIVGLTNLQTCRRAKGVYEVVIPPLPPGGYQVPCTFTDTWSNIVLNGFTLPNVVNEFNVYPLKKSIQIGTESQQPTIYGFDYYGIKQDEKILNTDVRKVGVIIKKAYTTNQLLQPNVDAHYRVYVKEGQTEVQVQDWTKINRTPNEYYFIFDTRDKIPNEYFIDLKVLNSGEVNTYKKQIKFQIVNKK
jgi:hypothetical protein